MADNSPTKEPAPQAPIRPSPNDQTPFDDPKTDRAVDEIVATESDELLAAEDAQRLPIQQPRPSVWRRFGRALAAPWRNTWARYSILLLVVGSASAVAVVPKTRYYVLNTYGATVGSSLQVTDDLTHQPLKNVTVRIAGVTGRTDVNGKVIVRGLRLGPTTLTIMRPGFDTYERPVTLGWGSNPLGTIALKGVGIRYTFIVKDFLTNKPIEGAEVVGGDASAVADKQGKAVLTLANTAQTEITAEVGKDGYRTEIVQATWSDVSIAVMLAVTRKAVFVSKEHGTFDVYSSDVDGQNKRLLVAGTGHETANISLVMSPDGTHAALVSTRDNQRDHNGGLLAALTLIDTRDGSTVTISHAVQIRLLDWIGTRLVFEQSTEDKNAGKHTILSYDYAANTRLELATAPRFTGALSAQGNIYYAVPAEEDTLTVKPGLFRIRPDGNNRQTMLDKEVWTMYRTGYDTLHLQTSDGWYATNLSSGTNEQTQAPTSYMSKTYIESPVPSGQSLWVDIQSGQGVLRLYNRQNGKETVVYQQAGLTYPLRWLTEDIVMYRVVNGTETADYAVSALGGGTPHKIADVINTYGFTAGQ